MNMPGLSDALRSRLASLLATEFSKKVSRMAVLKWMSLALRSMLARHPQKMPRQAGRGVCLKSIASARWPGWHAQ